MILWLVFGLVNYYVVYPERLVTPLYSYSAALVGPGLQSYPTISHMKGWFTLYPCLGAAKSVYQWMNCHDICHKDQLFMWVYLQVPWIRWEI